ncbi:MAG: DUF839 domain-containing protein [Planctomycetales bacterium]|nr:DUF839 domain-containing protein [Planctomycetales bacterium]MCA9169728.1 DUF839 domain-containing protein [Planctomycetales bacterium]
MLDRRKKALCKKLRKDLHIDSLENRLLMASDLGFAPVAVSVALNSIAESTAFAVADGFRAEVVQSRFDDSQLLSWPDMSTVNETIVRDHTDVGRYLFTTHETTSYAGVSRTDLWTGNTAVIAQRPDLERFDGIVWTPWGTLLAAEEVSPSSMSDPDHAALGGLVYEIDPFPEDLSTEFVADGAPIVIGHRGASGYRPEHTLASYALAIDLGADFIEPDLVSTKDGVLVARHENDITSTTDVAEHPEFADRKTTKVIDGVEITGWFTEDFTMVELKTLRATERLPDVRPENAQYDGQFQIPTFQEIINLVTAKQVETGRTIGLYPETKHPSYFDSIGLSLEEPLVAALDAAGYNSADAPVFIQSFEVSNLKDLNTMTDVPLVQLLWLEGQPYDAVAAGSSLRYDTMATPSGLAEISTYADGVGPEKNYFINRRSGNNLTLAGETSFVKNAHAAGLAVHPYTFRAEDVFLPANTTHPLSNGMFDELITMLHSGMDGFFTDQADLGVAARNAYANLTVRPALGALSHEGIALDAAGNVYVIDEFASGSIYRFTPDNYGDLASGTLAVLQVVKPDGDRTGVGQWTPLPGNLAAIDARQTARLVTLNKATTYSRPEDIEVSGSTLYVAITGEDRVLGIDLSDYDRPVVRNFVSGITMNSATSNLVGAEFSSPDNVAIDSNGRVFITEDPGSVSVGSDIWTAVDLNQDGIADRLGRFATLSTDGAEPTGIYFNPVEPDALYVNVQHPNSGNDQIVRFVPIDTEQLPFLPLPVSAAAEPMESDRELIAPLDLAEGWSQSVVQNGRDTAVLNGRNLDMITINATGTDAGRYLFTAHEVRRSDEFAPPADGAGVSRLDLQTGDVTLISQRGDYESFDGMTWTPWGTLITGEERTAQTFQDPDFPVANPDDPDAPTTAVSGLLYEIINPLGDPNDADPSLRPQTIVRPAVGSLAHEGMQFDAEGNLYIVHEFSRGSIYKFVSDAPNTPDALASGQLYALKVVNGGTSLNEDGSYQANSERLGRAEWVPLDRTLVQTNAQAAADAMNATQYWRPEDLAVGMQTDNSETLYVAITGRGGSSGNSGLRQLDGPRVISIALGDQPVVRNFVTPDTINAATGRRVGSEFESVDNIAIDLDGNVYLVEDNPNGDIWATRDDNGDGRADIMGRWASVSTLGAEPTGLYFNPLVAGEAFVNVQHPDSGWDATVRITQDDLLMSHVPGDVNGDGFFSSRDLVSVLQAGKYRTSESASWFEGDWNGDGYFDESDFVFVLSAVSYQTSVGAVAALENVTTFEVAAAVDSVDDITKHSQDSQKVEADGKARDIALLDLLGLV